MQKKSISAENSMKKDYFHVTCHIIARWRLQIFACKVSTERPSMQTVKHFSCEFYIST